MGYRTCYNLSIEKDSQVIPEDELKRIVQELKKVSSDAKDALDTDGSCETEIGSDDIIADLKEFSKNYPELVFELRYDGDETEDMGYIYFKNGKQQDDPVQINYNGFDESKLV